MKIQSLSIVVPNKKCINKCKFCVSRMHNEDYKNQMDCNLPFYDLYYKDYINRLEYARDNGCNTVMLTGNSEPQQNRHFLMLFGIMNQNLKNPFKTIEMQTTGAGLDEGYLRFLRNHVGVTTISLSVSSFEDDTNNYIIQTPKTKQIKLIKMIELIKKYDFNLRLSLNMNELMFKFNHIEKFKGDFNYLKELGIDQITFRKLYGEGENEEHEWIDRHTINTIHILPRIEQYIKKNGRELSILPYGAVQYEIHGMSVVVDNDCMSTEVKEEFKYLILREDCKLYSKWDSKASLIF